MSKRNFGFSYLVCLIAMLSFVFGLSVEATFTELGSITDDGKGGTASKIAAPLKVFIDGTKAYVISEVEDSLSIFDVSNPANITELGTISHTGVGGIATTMDDPTDVYVLDNKAYVTASEDSSLSIFDVSDPSNITELGTIDDPSQSSANNYDMRLASEVVVKSNHAFVISGSSSTITVFDVSNPASITAVGTDEGFDGVSISACIEEIVLIDNQLWGNCNSGIAIYDISNPSNLSLVNQVTGVGSFGGGFATDGTHAVTLSGSNNDGRMSVFDVSDVNNISLLETLRSTSEGGTVKNLSSPSGVAIDGNEVFIISGGVSNTDANNSLMKFTISGSDVSLTETIEDDGEGGDAIKLDDPSDIAAANSKLYIVTGRNSRFSDDSLAVFESTTVATPVVDTTNPSLLSMSPSHQASNISLGEDLVLTFDEAVTLNEGVIFKCDQNNDCDGFDVSDLETSQFSISGNTVTFPGAVTISTANPESLYIKIAQGTFVDASGNSYAGINDSTTWTFDLVVEDTEEPEEEEPDEVDDSGDNDTGDQDPPEIISMNPDHLEEDVKNMIELSMTFNEKVQKGSGEINIYSSEDDSLIDTVNVSSSLVDINSETVYFRSGIDINNHDNKGFYVNIDAGAFQDYAGNSFAGITGQSWLINSTDTDQPFPQGDDQFIKIDADDEFTISKTNKKLQLTVSRAPFTTGERLRCTLNNSFSGKAKRFGIKPAFGSKRLKVQVNKKLIREVKAAGSDGLRVGFDVDCGSFETSKDILFLFN
jgi:hypothetical protein